MEISKQFRIIRQEYKAVLNAGYELDERAERKEDFSDWHLKDGKEARERALRDFGELEDAALCIDEEDELAEQFDVSAIPCVVLIKDGMEADRSVGLKPREALEELL